MGAHPDDYKQAAPKNSYIHVDQFDSPEKLAEYLHELDKDDAKYNEYFRWKVSEETIISRLMVVCFVNIRFDIFNGSVQEASY